MIALFRCRLLLICRSNDRFPALHLQSFRPTNQLIVIDSLSDKIVCLATANMFSRYQNRMFKICECKNLVFICCKFIQNTT
jgi:hypothetical protein